MAYQVSQILNDNLRAIRIALEHQQGLPLPEEDTISLQKYAGFGGIKAILYPYGTPEEWQANGATKEDLTLHGGIMRLHELLKEHYPEDTYKEIIASLRHSVLTAFYTTEIVPQTLYSVLKEQGIQPKRLYEPSAGSGVFISEAAKAFPELGQITAIEKDRLTGLVLSAINSRLPVKTETHITGLEQAPVKDNGSYDLVVSNITDVFLNSPSNPSARRHLLERSDFVSRMVMPDNLMKDTGNTEAPNHLLIVQKNTDKKGFTADEQLLLATDKLQNEYGSYYRNLYIQEHPEIVAGSDIKPGKNQYGQAHETVWQYGGIGNIAEKLATVIENGIAERFNRQLFQKAQSEQPKEKLTYLPMPESRAANHPRDFGTS